MTATTLSASTSSYFSLLHQMDWIKFISSVFAFLPWVTYPNKALKQTVGTILVEFMACLELVVALMYSGQTGSTTGSSSSGSAAAAAAAMAFTRIHSFATTILGTTTLLGRSLTSTIPLMGIVATCMDTSGGRHCNHDFHPRLPW
jgi:hypothetical protein